MGGPVQIQKPEYESKSVKERYFASDMQGALGMLYDINDKSFTEAKVKDWIGGSRNSVTELLRSKLGGMVKDFDRFESVLRQKMIEAQNKTEKGDESLTIINLRHPQDGKNPTDFNFMEGTIAFLKSLSISTSDLGVDLKALARSGKIHNGKINDVVFKIHVIQASVEGVKNFEDRFGIYKATYGGGFDALKSFMIGKGYGKVYNAAVADAEKFISTQPPLPSMDPKEVIPIMLAREDSRQNIAAQRAEEQANYVAKLNDEFLSKLDEERAKRGSRQKQEDS